MNKFFFIALRARAWFCFLLTAALVDVVFSDQPQIKFPAKRCRKDMFIHLSMPGCFAALPHKCRVFDIQASRLPADPACSSQTT